MGPKTTQLLLIDTSNGCFYNGQSALQCEAFDIIIIYCSYKEKVTKIKCYICRKVIDPVTWFETGLISDR